MGEWKAIEPAGVGRGAPVVSGDAPVPGGPGGRVCCSSPGARGADAITDGPQAQMRRAYEEVGEVLAAAGASWDDVVSMNTYHVDFRRDIDAMIEVSTASSVSKEPFPAWTAVGVTQLFEPEAIVEILVTAVVPRSP